MAYIDIVTALALIQFLEFSFKVGGARKTYGIKAPAMTGHEIFERHFRVHYNTLESLIMFLPGLYLFGHYWNPLWAAALGVVYLIGREIYAASYVRDPAKRSAGYGLTFVPIVILVLGGLCGAVWHLVGGRG